MKNPFIFLTLLLVSIHSSAQWKRIGLDGTTVNCIAHKNDTLYAAGEDFFRSINYGATWLDVVGSNTNAFFEDITISRDSIYTGKNSENVLFSVDAGDNWAELPAPTDLGANASLCIAALKIANKNLYVGASCNGVYKWDISGQQWSRDDGGLPTQNIYSLASTDSRIYAGGSFGDIGMKNFSDATWTPDNLEGYVQDMFAKGDTVFAAASTSGIHISVNEGTSWLKKTILSTPNFSSVIYYKDILFAGSYNQGVFISNDMGDNWKEFNTGLNSSEIRDIMAKNDTIYIGTGNGIWVRPLTEANTTLSSKNKYVKSAINFYPNPASSTISFSLPLDKTGMLEVLNAKGIVVKKSFISNLTEVGIEDVPPGFYILKAIFEEGISFSKLEVVK